MPYNIVFHDDSHGVITHYFDTMTDADLIQSSKDRFASIDRLAALRYAIADCTQVTDYQVTTPGMREAAKLCVDASVNNQDLLLVGVLPTDLQFGMGRMGQAYMDESNWNMKLVRCRDEARDWLKTHGINFTF